MAHLDSAMTRLNEASRVRQTAEIRAGADWRDLVFRRVENSHFDPLARTDARLSAILLNLDSALASELGRL